LYVIDVISSSIAFFQQGLSITSANVCGSSTLIACASACSTSHVSTLYVAFIKSSISMYLAAPSSSESMSRLESNVLGIMNSTGCWGGGGVDAGGEA
jgi:hypothetical protein